MAVVGDRISVAARIAVTVSVAPAVAVAISVAIVGECGTAVGLIKAGQGRGEYGRVRGLGSQSCRFMQSAA